MIRVYAAPDRRARCIAFDDDAPPAPFELVASFDEQDRERAWALLHEPGDQPSAV